MAIPPIKWREMQEAIPAVAPFGLLQDMGGVEQREILSPGGATFDLCVTAQHLVSEIWPSLSVSSRLLARKVALVLGRFRLSSGGGAVAEFSSCLQGAKYRLENPITAPCRRLGGKVRVISTPEQRRLEPAPIDHRATQRGAAILAAFDGLNRPGEPPDAVAEAVASAAN
jgi:hypothetical protein